MTNFLLESVKPLGNQDNNLFTSSSNNDQIFDGHKQPQSEEGKWQEMLVPPGMRDRTEALPLDLNTLLKVLDEHNKDGEDPNQGTLQLVLIQAVLLTLLVVCSISWACCCKKRCFKAAPPSVHEALRKLSSNASLKSRDFPPSYSTADLHTLAMSVHDYLYPPPEYNPELFRRSCDDLAYLDLEGGHRQLSRLSFSGTSSPVVSGHPPLSRQASSLSYLESRRSSISQDSDSSRKNSIMKDSCSRKSSSSQDSRRSSRVSFSEAVEVSNGSFRRLSGSQELSRKSSSSSSGSESRKSSLLLSRKLGLSQESLDQELRKKLEAIEMDENEVAEVHSPSVSGETSLETVIEIEKY